MGKNLKFILALSFLLSFAFASVASNESIHLSTASNLCDAPPPEDFRVTEIGPGFISLAWDPTWIGATYTLTIQSNSASNGIEVWTIPDTFRNISGTSFTLTNRPTGFVYRIKISTNCAFNTPSTQVDSISQKTVLELITPGRTPFNPTVVDCENIEYNNGINEWVGFRVTYNNEGFITSNLFEFAIEYDKKVNSDYYTTVQIKRVNSANPIVAGNSEPDWPELSNPLVFSDNPFYMYYINNGSAETIGSIYISGEMSYTPLIDICIYPSPAWDHSHYTFEPLVAKSVMFFPEFSVKEPDYYDNIKNRDSYKLTVENPVYDNISIRLNKDWTEVHDGIFKIFNLNGQLISSGFFAPTLNSTQLSIPATNIPSGIYILQINTNANVFTSKLFKPN